MFLGLVAAVACLRLYYCACLPVNTGDVLRHLAWGCVVNESGYAAADRSLADNRPAAGWVAWRSTSGVDDRTHRWTAPAPITVVFVFSGADTYHTAVPAGFCFQFHCHADALAHRPPVPVLPG